jgi:hypothetical protein
LNLHRQVGDLLMPQPLAVLNDEEMHWLNDLGLPNQRRWLNHRTLGDEHRRTFPSAATDISITSHKEAHKAQKRSRIFLPQKRTKSTKEEDRFIESIFVLYVPFCG